MKLEIYQVDAFTNRLFGGNPAAVVPLENWIDDELMQNLAMENNLAETVFFVPNGNEFDIRWFTPVLEINLCGHATLASAFVLYQFKGYNKPKLTFNSKSGKLVVEKKENNFRMDFPSWRPEKLNEYHPGLQDALGVNEIVAVYKYRDLLVELNAEEEVKKVQPDFTALKKIGEKVIITAPGKEVDFVSRFFAPASGIDEDPVTGSAHCVLASHWRERTGKSEFRAYQASRRGGSIGVRIEGRRVLLTGRAVLVVEGQLLAGH